MRNFLILVDPRGIEPRPLALQASARTSYARDPLNILEELTMLSTPLTAATNVFVKTYSGGSSRRQSEFI
jgi:hypothetical protein